MENMTGLISSIREGKLEESVALVESAIKNNVPPQVIINDYLVKGSRKSV